MKRALYLLILTMALDALVQSSGTPEHASPPHRYFTVSYNFGSGSFGDYHFETDGGFPNNIVLRNNIKKLVDIDSNKPLVILYIFEFKSKEDYENYDRTAKEPKS